VPTPVAPLYGLLRKTVTPGVVLKLDVDDVLVNGDKLAVTYHVYVPPFCKIPSVSLSEYEVVASASIAIVCTPFVICRSYVGDPIPGQLHVNVGRIETPVKVLAGYVNTGGGNGIVVNEKAVW
jgi:hypothetical protein